MDGEIRTPIRLAGAIGIWGKELKQYRTLRT